MADIYGLYSTRNGRVRYVGQSGDARLRFEEHRRDAEHQVQSRVSAWFRQEWRDGHRVRYAILEECDFDKRHGVETVWINRFPTFELLNKLKTRRWWEKPLRPPVVPEIAVYMRRHVFNVEGFRGVHYDRHVGYYRVQVYNGYWVKWLEGDELPGGSAPIWFSDLARALDARDGKKPQPLMERRRRRDIRTSHVREQERLRTEDFAW